MMVDAERCDRNKGCYAENMPSVTSSFRMSKELQRVLSALKA
jgi:hypothetical protein